MPRGFGRTGVLAIWTAVVYAQSAPPVTGPLKMPDPATFDAGPLGKLGVSGVLSGFGLAQSNRFASDASAQADLSNGQVFVQKTDGWWQFYLQAGAYNFVQLGLPFLPTGDTVKDLYGPLPIAYLKLAPAKNTSVMIGALPSLMGAEAGFTFENMNIERGLLWNQENTVNRGIQVNQTVGKFTASLSWNDGYYSNRYSWLSGSLTYSNGPHSIVFSGMGNLSRTAFQTTATPVQNDSTMYAVIYTYTKGPWIVQPYFQYSDLPVYPRIGIGRNTGTRGGAVLLSHSFQHGFSLAGRWEYLATTGNVNLLAGPGSSATSFTVTPTFQSRGFFVRGEFSLVHALDLTAGAAFGPGGSRPNQPRVVGEIGFLFGHGVI
jgi:hypothetical protein